MPSEQFLFDDEVFPGPNIVAAENPETLDFLPTRWGGSRCIDYFVTSCPQKLRSVELFDEAIADRKVVTSEIVFDDAGQTEFPYKFKKAPDLCKPDEVDSGQWFTFCQDFIRANHAPM